MTQTAPHAVVIGAGVAGLATAALLGREGWRGTLCGGTDAPGGRMGELSVDGFRFETGPSWYLMPEVFERFFAHFGTSPDAEYGLERLDPAYRVYSSNGRSLDVRTGHAVELFDSVDPGSGARLRAYLDQAAEIYRIAEEKFLYTTFSRPADLVDGEVLRRLPELARLLTEPLASKAARVTRDPLLRQVLEYPAVFLASRPERIPSLYHLMSHADLTAGVVYPRGGFAALGRAMVRVAEAQGVRIRTGCEVTAITSTAGRADGVRLADGERIVADAVISCADLHHTENSLLPRGKRSYPERRWARRDPGPGVVLVLLGVRGELPGLLHHTLFFDADWRADFDAVFSGPDGRRDLPAACSMYVCRASASDPTLAPAGCENLFMLVPTPADPAIGHGDAYGAAESPTVRAIADAAVARLGARLGVGDLAGRVVVRRTIGPADFAGRYHAWRGSALGLAHTLGQSAFLRGRNVSDKLDGLYYAGSTTLPGVGVPMCLISAENVLTRMRERGERGFGGRPE